jgi:hypothetical protein
MFNLTIVTKSEKLLWRHQVEMLQDRCEQLEEKIKHLEKRNDAAINALLAKQARVILSPEPTAAEQDREVVEFENLVEKTFGIFEDDEQEMKKQADFMEALQR